MNGGTDLLTEVNVEPVQEYVVAIYDTLEVGLKVIDHIEHGQVGGACLNCSFVFLAEKS